MELTPEAAAGPLCSSCCLVVGRQALLVEFVTLHTGVWAAGVLMISTPPEVFQPHSGATLLSVSSARGLFSSCCAALTCGSTPNSIFSASILPNHAKQPSLY